MQESFSLKEESDNNNNNNQNQGENSYKNKNHNHKDKDVDIDKDKDKKTIPLWQLCQKSLTPEENQKQFRQFYENDMKFQHTYIEKKILYYRLCYIGCLFQIDHIANLNFQINLYMSIGYLIFLLIKFEIFTQQYQQEVKNNRKQQKQKLKQSNKFIKILTFIVFFLGYTILNKVLCYCKYLQYLKNILILMIFICEIDNSHTYIYSLWYFLSPCQNFYTNFIGLMFSKSKRLKSGLQSESLQMMIFVDIMILALRCQWKSMIWMFVLYGLIKICLSLDGYFSKYKKKHKDYCNIIDLQEYY